MYMHINLFKNKKFESILANIRYCIGLILQDRNFTFRRMNFVVYFYTLPYKITCILTFSVAAFDDTYYTYRIFDK